jgi:glycosyltransferase involved in cell wall biosynthesis
LAPPQDPRAFAALLRTLLGDAARRDALGTAARRRALERFSLEHMIAAYVDLVEAMA